ncbi:AraC family transcriptional regulator [Pedobacter nototheniae]|uniref:helix-turn-helix transcriptional regulator n=1 Tax=Pedobacter nototheniae TaxID=2488994 RepID=UPI00292F45DE|nr:AraC family transcriptional regulator [Pedobacter nototheniae]
MEALSSGNFFGNTDQTIKLDGLTITNTEYTHAFVDWHFHENAYFTFLLAGQVSEINKKERHNCGSGTLPFHNCQEPHYNIKPKGYTKGMHLELSPKWLKEFADNDIAAGSFEVINPLVKSLFHQILLSAKNQDDTTPLSIHALTISALDKLSKKTDFRSYKQPPDWINKLEQLLQDNPHLSHSLESISDVLGIHPVHISRYFPKYFGCNLGAYIRSIRLCRAAAELNSGTKSAIQIAFECGFYDQTHLIKCFKEEFRVTPHQYQRYLR